MVYIANVLAFSFSFYSSIELRRCKGDFCLPRDLEPKVGPLIVLGDVLKLAFLAFTSRSKLFNDFFKKSRSYFVYYVSFIDLTPFFVFINISN